MLLGASDEDVMTEYLLTNRDLLPAMQPVLDRFASAGGDPELLVPVLGVREDYLEVALQEMTSLYGTIEGYFEQWLGLDAGMSTLRDALIEPAEGERSA